MLNTIYMLVILINTWIARIDVALYFLIFMLKSVMIFNNKCGEFYNYSIGLSNSALSNGVICERELRFAKILLFLQNFSIILLQ